MGVPACHKSGSTPRTRDRRSSTSMSSLLDPFRCLRQARPIERGARAARRAACASTNASRSRRRPRASARHCRCSWLHASSSGLAGRVAFCAAASCAADSSPSITTRLLAAHSRSWLVLSAPSRTRTDTGRILSPLPLPIGLWGPGGESSARALRPGHRIPPKLAKYPTCAQGVLHVRSAPRTLFPRSRAPVR